MKSHFSIFIFFILLLFGCRTESTPIDALLERIEPGASDKFIIEKVADNSGEDFFELDQNGRKVVVKGNNWISIATGLNWYLKYYAHIHLCWNQMSATLPDPLPMVEKPERRETQLMHRYNFNYCTYSYSMAFWDWERWQQEIDWMALHGINMPLTLTGTETVWRNTLRQFGYTDEEIGQFIASPAFMAWWLMNNLEGWGGPNPESCYEQQVVLQQKILQRMAEYDMNPVFAGYSGMLPSNANEKMGLSVADPGKWCGYVRPAFLQPTDARFQEIAQVYYTEQQKLFGVAEYYSMDPFHEGGDMSKVNLEAAGKEIWSAMKKVNKDAVWVIQGWGGNPQPQMIDSLPVHDVMVLDLFAESQPQWGDTLSPRCRKNGFGKHDWLYCMLLNFGGNIGLHGRMDALLDRYYRAEHHAQSMQGIGLTYEGSENNPVMYELFMELPWRSSCNKSEWLKSYATARYGKQNNAVDSAWMLLGNSIYNCPAASVQQGTTESIFCSRPDENVRQASTWLLSTDYYQPNDVIEAARLMLTAADEFEHSDNFEYDLVDIVRQAVAEKGRMVYQQAMGSYQNKEVENFKALSQRFLQLILLQDELLATQPEFSLGPWIEKAVNKGTTDAEKALYEWNARVQITTWGNRTASESGGLHDYAHKEWSGILKDLYYKRWKLYFDYLTDKLSNRQPAEIDFYAIDEAWAKEQKKYAATAQGAAIPTARKIFEAAVQKN